MNAPRSLPVFGLPSRRRLVTRQVAVAALFAAVLPASGNAQTLQATRPLGTSPEAQVYARAHTGVFRVEAGLNSGSAFLVDTLGGLLVTNAHVIGSNPDPSIYLDSATRVPAQVVVRDQDADLALLRISRSVCTQCRALAIDPLLTDNVVPGERVVAMGFPLHQGLSITSGIVSSLRLGGIITDVDVNPGNSGGPLLTTDGSVIGVVTFVDQSTSGPGAGIAGAIPIERLAPLLQRARDTLPHMAEPSTERLPTVPTSGFPIGVLKAVADTASSDLWSGLRSIDAGPFTILLSTPLRQFVGMKDLEREVAGNREKREQRARITEEDRYSELRQYRDWDQFVASRTAPVVTISVTPKTGQTLGSILGQSLSAVLIGAVPPAVFKFKGDVDDVRLYRNGSFVRPLRGGHTPVREYISDVWVELKDVADEGFYLYDPKTFAPLANGSAPAIVIEVHDLAHPDDPVRVTLTPYSVARLWNDFQAYYEAVEPQSPFHAYHATRSCRMVYGASVCEERVH